MHDFGCCFSEIELSLILLLNQDEFQVKILLLFPAKPQCHTLFNVRGDHAGSWNALCFPAVRGVGPSISTSTLQ